MTSLSSLAQIAQPDHLLADAEFAALDARRRAEVHRVLDAMAEACASAGSVGEAVQRFGLALGVPAGTARRRWDAVKRHGWMGAIDGRRRRHGGHSVGRRPAFLTYWRSLCDKHARSLHAAWHDLIVWWRSGAAIPGYEDYGGRPPSNPRTGLPIGWHYANLIRFAPRDTDRTLARLGPKALHMRTTTLWTSRVGMRVGQTYQVDDVWHDFHVLFGGAALVRPLELGIIDLFSTRRVLAALCPRVKDASESFRGLREAYTVWLVVLLLQDYGYDPDGCVIVAEHGTAAIREPVEAALFRATAGKVRVERSAIMDKPAMLGWWAGEGGGNPNMKACLESLHNLYHNRLGLLPAPSGSLARLNAPETQVAIERYARGIARELAHVPPEQVDGWLGLMRLPALSLQQAHALIHEYYALIDARTEHALEGWDRAGLVRAQWRVSAESADWHDQGELATLDDPAYNAVRALLDGPGGKDLVRPQRLSPRQVWDAGLPRLRRLPPWVTHQIVPREHAREIRVRQHRIEFDDAAIEPDGLRYETVATDPAGRRVLLEEDGTYLFYVNPLRPSAAIVTDPDGGYVGQVQRIERATRADRESLFRAIGQAARREEQRSREWRERNAPDAVALQADLAHNEQILDLARALQAPCKPAAESLQAEPAADARRLAAATAETSAAAALDEVYGR